MSLSMYQASIPTFVRMLGNLSAMLDKAAAHTESKKIDPAALLQYRLALDMLPLAFQIRTATDMAARGAARLAGMDPPASPTPRRPSPSSRRASPRRSRSSSR